MKPIVLVVGAPGSGKTTLCEKIRGKFFYVPHDDFKERDYPSVLAEALKPTRGVIGEIPFGLSKIQGILEAAGLRVIPVFILEPEHVLKKRWDLRGNVAASTRQGHLNRQETYRARAKETGAFAGTADQVFDFLQKLDV